MATAAERPLAPAAGEERFFLRCAIVMTVTIIAAFSYQYMRGRSTFAAPLHIHAHAILATGWMTIFLLQNYFVATDRMRLHRRVGWIAVGWIVPMTIMASWVTVAMVRQGHPPPQYRPQHFLIFNLMGLFTFVGLTIAAILLRRHTDWHRRLHFCAMSMLLTPAFARLLPGALLRPWAWEAGFAALMLFPLAGVWRDIRDDGQIHPAWRWGIATMMAAFILTEAVTYSRIGTLFYDAVTENSQGASLPPLDFPPPRASR